MLLGEGSFKFRSGGMDSRNPAGNVGCRLKSADRSKTNIKLEKCTGNCRYSLHIEGDTALTAIC